MKILILAAVVVVSLAVPSPRMVEQEWDIFKSEHAKVYDNDQHEAERLAIFHDNLIKIEKHNKLYEQGLVTYKLGVTPFADMTTEEFLIYVNSSLAPIKTRREKITVSVENLKATLDWRQYGVVTGAKDQGACGSCWSFSATGALEGRYALKYGRLISLSEQNLIDCSGGYGNQGCNGGWMPSAYQYVRDHGITTEGNYPYEAVQRSCRYNGQSVLKVVTYYEFQASTSNVQAACYYYGPLSVALHATSNLQHYRGGILYDNTCSSNTLNHGVLLVGYGDNYWLVKNSWGAGWGENGYFRISNSGTGCGITTASSVPILG